MLLNPNVSLRQAGTADWPAIERLLLDNKLPTQGARDHLATYLLASPSYVRSPWRQACIARASANCW
jgi:hypothetical protein